MTQTMDEVIAQTHDLGYLNEDHIECDGPEEDEPPCLNEVRWLWTCPNCHDHSFLCDEHHELELRICAEIIRDHGRRARGICNTCNMTFFVRDYPKIVRPI